MQPKASLEFMGGVEIIMDYPAKYHQCINLIIEAKWHKIGCSTLGNNIVSFQCCNIPYHGLRMPNEAFVH